MKAVEKRDQKKQQKIRPFKCPQANIGGPWSKFNTFIYAIYSDAHVIIPSSKIHSSAESSYKAMHID